MKQYLSLLLFNFLILNTYSQLFFEKTYSDLAYSSGRTVFVDNDGNYIIGAITASSQFNSGKAVIMKTDQNGTIIWKKSFTGNVGEFLNTIIKTRDGGYMLAGTTYSDNNQPYGNTFLVKLDSVANVQWKKNYGYTGQDDPYAIIQTKDGGYVIGCLSNSFGSGGYEMMAFKIDSTGSSPLFITLIGGIGNDNICSMIETADSSIVVAASSNSWSTNMIADYEFILYKLSKNGTLKWIKKINRGSGNSICNSLLQTNDGGFIMAGWNDGAFGMGQQDMFVVKTDSLGTVQWMKSYGGFSGDFANKIIKTNGGYLITGYTKSTVSTNEDVFLFKIDYNGDFKWFKRYGGNAMEMANDLCSTPDGSNLIVGLTKSFGTNPQEMYFIKTDSLGMSPCNTFIDSIGTNPPIVIVNQLLNPIPDYNKGLFFLPLNLSISTTGSMSTICSSLVGTNDIEKNNSTITIYPNPSSDFVKVSDYKNTINSIVVYNSLGQIVFQSENNKTLEINIDVSDWNNGCYFLRITSNNITTTKKLIKNQ